MTDAPNKNKPTTTTAKPFRPISGIMSSPANADLLYKNRQRNGWKCGPRYEYKNERLTVPEIAARAGQSVEFVRRHISDAPGCKNWKLERFFEKFGDAGPAADSEENAHTEK